MKINYLSLALFLAVMAVGCNKQTSNSQPPPQQPAPVVQRPAPAVQQPTQASAVSRSRILGAETPATTTETYAVATLRNLNTAEVAYLSDHPSDGFTCQVADLVPLYSALPDHLRKLKDDYKVTLTGCDGPPATKYWITAVPVAPESGFWAFCANEDDVIRYADDGKQESCVGSRLEGEVVTEPESEPQDQAVQRATVQRVSGEAVSQFQILSTQKKFLGSYSDSFIVELTVRNSTTHDLWLDVHFYATDGGTDVQQGTCTATSLRPNTTAEVHCYPMVIGHPNAEIKLGEPSLHFN